MSGRAGLLSRDAEAMITCSICMEHFNNPKILTCQHSFCLSCLQNCLLRSPSLSNLQCPKCRKMCHLDSRGLDGLPADFKTTQLMDMMRNIGSDNNDR